MPLLPFANARGSSGITIGTTAITSGTSTRVLYDLAGAVQESANLTIGTSNAVTITEIAGGSGLTITGATQTTSQPALNITQTWNAAQTFTAIKLNITNTSSNTGSKFVDIQVGGTTKIQAVNASSGGQLYVYGTTANDFAQLDNRFLQFGNNSVGITCSLLDDGSGKGTLKLGALGYISWQSTNRIDSGSIDTVISRGGAAAVVQLGQDVNGAAVSQQLQACNGITGTDKTGGSFTIASGKGTGAGAVSSLIFQTPTVLASGTTAQSLATRLTLNSTTMTSTVQGIFPASTTSLSSLRLPHGSAPTSPVDGDMWTTTAGLYVRINGATVGPLT